jgi:hypothetical protein
MNLEFAQAILAAAILGFGVYVFRLRTVRSDQVIYLILAVGGLAFIFVPNLSTLIANIVGIGRGTDLILYGFVVFSLFHFATLVSHLNRLERQITALARRDAVMDAQFGGHDSAPSRSGAEPPAHAVGTTKRA